jgi:hypothetical protein
MREYWRVHGLGCASLFLPATIPEFGRGGAVPFELLPARGRMGSTGGSNDAKLG